MGLLGRRGASADELIFQVSRAYRPERQAAVVLQLSLVPEVQASDPLASISIAMKCCDVEKSNVGSRGLSGALIMAKTPSMSSVSIS